MEYVDNMSWIVKFIPKFFMHRYSTKGSIELPLHVIDKGLRISNPTGNIILGGAVKHIGEHCALSTNILMGGISIKKDDDDITIGNYVYVAPFVHIYGKCHIGDHVIISTDTVIRKQDIPSNSIVYGNPCVIKPFGLVNATFPSFYDA
ncbi:MAG: hypothetical protein PUI88_02850 [Prevotella sp.]|nr:hypothetical protein [Prevotella sp.]